MRASGIGGIEVAVLVGASRSSPPALACRARVRSCDSAFSRLRDGPELQSRRSIRWTRATALSEVRQRPLLAELGLSRAIHEPNRARVPAARRCRNALYQIGEHASRSDTVFHAPSAGPLTRVSASSRLNVPGDTLLRALLPHVLAHVLPELLPIASLLSVRWRHIRRYVRCATHPNVNRILHRPNVRLP